jgi:hypothetical protein
LEYLYREYYVGHFSFAWPDRRDPMMTTREPIDTANTQTGLGLPLVVASLPRPHV